jgi:membrane fusion protein (multidrug efflux system)
MKRRNWVVALALFLVLLIAYRVRSHREAAERNRAAASRHDAIPVSIQPVRSGLFEVTAHLTGNVEPIQSVQVISKIRGRVARVVKEIGDPVKVGDTLVVIDPIDYGLEAKRLEGVLEQARADHQQADRDLVRAQELAKVHVISTQALQAAESRSRVAGGREKEAEAALDLARQRLSDTNITSPIDGVVTGRFVDVGTMVDNQMMGDRAAVAVYDVKNLRRVKLSVGISEKDLPRSQVGQRARVRVGALPDRTFEGTLMRISPSLSQGTRRAQAEIEIDNPESLLKPGMFATADLVLDRQEGVIAVPKDAVLDRGGRPVVFVARGDRAKMIPVTLGSADDQSAVVISGLSPGDRLILKGQTILEDGSAIFVEAESAAPSSPSASASATP